VKLVLHLKNVLLVLILKGIRFGSHPGNWTNSDLCSFLTLEDERKNNNVQTASFPVSNN
jgi:hypothetical protein